ncbi:SDR family oxidoreductase [Hymenobacter sp. YC55]|uniref:SDR family NAD(P)-dependent oxidoreductase n=1 Tax=Hymenobacter sp. YC55 TaxID=3034019 RepID=UPI0023F96238|nr:SDR family oxidoreductase [Hymenobacter sp. YC55]MDF7815885.1 SDR family oxidoreductase [Hymenobacter sp. YC55]
MNRLRDKVALITGGGTGIGAATAALFAQEGAKVMITGNQKTSIEEVAQAINQSQGTAAYTLLDITQEADWNRALQETVALYGQLDIVVNNAGISGNLALPLAERTQQEFTRVLSVNLTGQFLGLKTAAPYLPLGASIVNVSSIAGITGNAGANAYTASKGGSRLLSKGAAVELAAQGIRVNSVHPGFIDTPMVRDMAGADDFKQMAVSHTPLGRGGSPNEVAQGILFLASPEASYITGAELVIDGGFTAF